MSNLFVPAHNLWTPQYMNNVGLWLDASSTEGLTRGAPSGGYPTVSAYRSRDPRHRTFSGVGGGALVTRDGSAYPNWYLDNAIMMSLDATDTSWMTPINGGFTHISLFHVYQFTAGLVGDGAGTYLWDRKQLGANAGLFSLKASSNDKTGTLGSTQWAAQVRSDSGTGLFTESFSTGMTVVTTAQTLITLKHSPTVASSSFNGNANRLTSYGSTMTITPDPLSFSYFNANASGFYVQEHLYFPRWLTDYEQRRVEGYLAHKWRMNLVASHPYSQRAPTVGPAGLFGAPLKRLSPNSDTSNVGWTASDAGSINHAEYAASDAVNAFTNTHNASVTVRLG